MINRVKFENFRGLKNLELSGLNRITLISGKNNAGKSSVLEGIFLMLDHTSSDSFVKINRFRGLPISGDPTSLWEPMFYDLDSNQPLRIAMELNNGLNVLEYSRDDSFVPTEAAGTPQDVWNQLVTSAKSTYTLRFTFRSNDYLEDGHFVVGASGMLRNMELESPDNQLKSMPFAQYINNNLRNSDADITEWFGKLELEGKKQQVIEILKIIDSSICDISTIALRGQTQLYAKMSNKLIPLKLAGDGINKLLFIVLAIIENPNSIILIDEIETGFHYSMYPKLWNIIAQAAHENNCQIIATTHSYECIDGAIQGVENAGLADEFCYYRVERTQGENKAFRFSGSLLNTAIISNMEVR